MGKSSKIWEETIFPGNGMRVYTRYSRPERGWIAKTRDVRVIGVWPTQEDALKAGELAHRMMAIEDKGTVCTPEDIDRVRAERRAEQAVRT